MTTKQWLSRAWCIEEEINDLMERRVREREKLTSITQKLAGDTVQSTYDPHKFDRLVQLNGEIDKQLDRLYQVKAEVTAAIGRLDKGAYRRILEYRYIDRMSFEAIACKIHYSYKQTCRLHGRALIEMGEIIAGLRTEKQ